jgi:hypothetical protein
MMKNDLSVAEPSSLVAVPSSRYDGLRIARQWKGTLLRRRNSNNSNNNNNNSDDAYRSSEISEQTSIKSTFSTGSGIVQSIRYLFGTDDGQNKCSTKNNIADATTSSNSKNTLQLQYLVSSLRQYVIKNKLLRRSSTTVGQKGTISTTTTSIASSRNTICSCSRNDNKNSPIDGCYCRSLPKSTKRRQTDKSILSVPTQDHIIYLVTLLMTTIVMMTAFMVGHQPILHWPVILHDRTNVWSMTDSIRNSHRLCWEIQLVNDVSSSWRILLSQYISNVLLITKIMIQSFVLGASLSLIQSWIQKRHMFGRRTIKTCCIMGVTTTAAVCCTLLLLPTF